MATGAFRGASLISGSGGNSEEFASEDALERFDAAIDHPEVVRHRRDVSFAEEFNLPVALERDEAERGPFVGATLLLRFQRPVNGRHVPEHGVAEFVRESPPREPLRHALAEANALQIVTVLAVAGAERMELDAHRKHLSKIEQLLHGLPISAGDGR